MRNVVEVAEQCFSSGYRTNRSYLLRYVVGPGFGAGRGDAFDGPTFKINFHRRRNK